MTETMRNDAALQLIAEGVDDVAAGNYKIAQGRGALAANLSAPPKPVEPAPELQPPAAPVTRVDTLAALTTALKQARAGEVIELATGDYGALSLKAVVAPSVTVRGPGAKVTGLQLNACEGIAFEGLIADLAAGGVVKLDACKNVALIGLTSRNAKYYGVSILRSQGVRVRDCDIADVKDGVQMLNCRHVLVQGNKIRRFRADGVNMSGCSYTQIIGNDIADSAAAAGAHPDGVQVQTSGAAGAAENVEIRGNTMRRGTGAPYQGVFATIQAGGQRHRNIIVADNVIEGGLYNGIMVASADGVEITGNTVQPYTDQKSWIRLVDCTAAKLVGNDYAQLLLENVSDLDRRDTETLSAIAPR